MFLDTNSIGVIVRFSIFCEDKGGANKETKIRTGRPQATDFLPLRLKIENVLRRDIVGGRLTKRISQQHP